MWDKTQVKALELLSKEQSRFVNEELKQGSDGIWGMSLRELTPGCSKSHETFQLETEHPRPDKPTQDSKEMFLRKLSEYLQDEPCDFFLRQPGNGDWIGHQCEYMG